MKINKNFLIIIKVFNYPKNKKRNIKQFNNKYNNYK